MSIDTTLFLALNGSATSPHWLTALAVFSTRHLPELLAAGAAGVFLAGSRRVRMGVLQVLAAMAVAFVLAHLGQLLIARDRPFVLGLGTQWLPHRASHSFPSAHASVSFAFACAAAMVMAAGFWLVPVKSNPTSTVPVLVRTSHHSSFLVIAVCFVAFFGL